MAVSNEMVRLYKDLFGRGPTQSRSDWAGADALVCTLENTLTPAERKMVELGGADRVRDMRTFFQYASDRAFCDSVERITGREVRAFVSGIDVAQDVATELFYFEPRPEIDVPVAD